MRIYVHDGRAALCVQVCSSGFPKLTRTPSTGERAEYAARVENATRTLWRSPIYRSRIILPVRR